MIWETFASEFFRGIGKQNLEIVLALGCGFFFRNEETLRVSWYGLHVFNFHLIMTVSRFDEGFGGFLDLTFSA